MSNSRGLRRVVGCLLLAAPWGCGEAPAPAPEPSRPAQQPAATAPSPAPASPSASWIPDRSGDLIDEAELRGVDYVNRSGSRDKSIVLEANGAGVCLLDLGSDGDLDIVFSQGLERFEDVLTKPGADLEIFENDGRGQFRRAEGPQLRGWWTGLAAGDVDNDGDSDLLAAGYGDLVLLLQDASGRLVRGPPIELGFAQRLEYGRAREKGGAPLWLTSLALFDADGDGNLDLYACAYLELDPSDPPRHALGEGALAVPCRWKGYEVFCGPSGMKAQADRLFLGDGRGHFADRSAALVDQRAAFGLGVAAFDADGDGDSDLYVANDSTPNFLWINDGSGKFADVALSAGVALSKDGMAEAGMGVAVADVDRDGRLDLCVTNFSGEPTQLYLGADIGFRSLTHRLGLLRETRALLSWGVHLIDFDGDTFPELLTMNGHVYPQADLEGTGTRYHQAPTLWRLVEPNGEFKLTLAQPSAERSLLGKVVGARGSAVGDLDNDGRSDVVVNHIDAKASVVMNRLGRAQRRFALRLEGRAKSGAPDATGRSAPDEAQGGRRTPRDAMGARVAVLPEIGGFFPSEFALLREVQTSSSFQSSNSPWLEFGLGPCERVREVRVDWPSGHKETFGPFPAGVRATLREGSREVLQEPLQ